MLPTLSFNPKTGKRVKEGHPWAYSNEIKMDAAAKALEPGSLVQLADDRGAFVALAHFNPHTLIAARVLARGVVGQDGGLDAAFWQEKIQRALTLRDGLYVRPYYRLVHAEADGLPGLIIDRYGEHLVIQPNTAGMQKNLPDLVAALNATLKTKSIILRGDTPSRGLEGLAEEVTALQGTPPDRLAAEENGLSYIVDGIGGQKTGWFYDQRRNRALVADLAKGKTVLDLYTHTGGFGLLAAQRGAADVLCVDRSEHALGLARATAEKAGLDKARFEKADVFDFCATQKGQRYDVVVADPPAFAKSRKDVPAASRGYRKLARMAANLVAKNGYFFMASCSHAIIRERFDEAVIAGINDAGRQGAILARTEADLDHPTHSHLPESAYLKGILVYVD